MNDALVALYMTFHEEDRPERRHLVDIPPEVTKAMGAALATGTHKALIRHETYLAAAATYGIDLKASSETPEDVDTIYERAMQQAICDSLPFLAAAQRTRQLQRAEEALDVAALLLALSTRHTTQEESRAGTD